jgi:hypothetical protein
VRGSPSKDVAETISMLLDRLYLRKGIFCEGNFRSAFAFMLSNFYWLRVEISLFDFKL